MIQFNRHGNLENDLTLTCTEFKQLFGFNTERERKIDNLFIVAYKFKQLGCETMFLFGSFVTAAEQPNDVDVCFDVSMLDKKIIENNYSILDIYERKRFKEYFLVHVILKETENINILKWMRRDRESNEKGIIEVHLKDLPVYDKK